MDSNHRPSDYEPDELPTAPSRDILFLVVLCLYNYLVIPLGLEPRTLALKVPYSAN